MTKPQPIRLDYDPTATNQVSFAPTPTTQVRLGPNLNQSGQITNQPQLIRLDYDSTPSNQVRLQSNLNQSGLITNIRILSNEQFQSRFSFYMLKRFIFSQQEHIIVHTIVLSVLYTVQSTAFITVHLYLGLTDHCSGSVRGDDQERCDHSVRGLQLLCVRLRSYGRGENVHNARL